MKGLRGRAESAAETWIWSEKSVGLRSWRLASRCIWQVQAVVLLRSWIQRGVLDQLVLRSLCQKEK